MTPQPLPPVDLDEIERLLSEATPRPWADDGDAIITEDPGEVDMERVLIADTRYFTIPRRQANAALIVALVNSAPGLIARIRQLEGALERAADAMERVSIFVNTHNRIKQPEGAGWWTDECIAARLVLTGAPE